MSLFTETAFFITIYWHFQNVFSPDFIVHVITLFFIVVEIDSKYLNIQIL